MIQINKKFVYLITTNIIFLLIFLLPQTAFPKPLNSKIWINTQIKKSFSNKDYHNSLENNSAGFQYNKTFNNIKLKFAPSYDSNQKIIFDNSLVEYKNKNKILGIGKTDRNWSFSPHTSLIISKNARPANSIYFIYNNKKKSTNLLTSWTGPLSLEVFNSFPSGPNKTDNSMLLGMRAVIEPYHNVKFELAKTSQWGGNEHSSGIPSFLAAIFGNTNTDEHRNINQVAGFGISFLTKIKESPSRFYTQLIGEDEAGNLPSCYMGLIGAEFEFPTGILFSKLGLEYTDTRTYFTDMGHCGPNAAYNNNTYSYTNYGKTMGTSIDTESKSFSIYISKDISEKIHLFTSIQDVTINDNNWSQHRLSTSKVNGLQASIGTFYKANSFNFRTNISFQNFSLDRADYNKGFNFSLNSEYNF